MMSDFSFGEAQSADYAELVQILQEIKSDSNFNSAQFSWTEQSLTEEFKFSKTWILKDTSAHIGAFLCFRQNHPDYEIMLLATRPRYRRRGLQSRVLQKLLQQASIEKAVVRLEVHSGNSSAIELYKKNNFVIAGKRVRYYRDGADALLMIWPESAAP